METQKQNQQKIKINQTQQQKTLKNQKEKEIKSKYQQKKIPLIKPNKKIKTQILEVEHQEEENVENTYNIKDNENIEISQENGDNSFKKPKYSSYFGDLNNNYHEIRGLSGSDEKNENEEEEEENEENENENIKENTKKRNEKGIQSVKKVTFGIQSENLYVPAQTVEDKEEKEADEQIMEEDEQKEINFENGQEMEESEEDVKKDKYEENEEEGEMVGDEMIYEDDNENEEYNENEMIEGEEIEENNYNEEEEYNEENEYEEN